MSSEQKALEIIKVLANHIQEADAAGVQAVIYADALYDQTTIGDAILSAAGIETADDGELKNG